MSMQGGMDLHTAVGEEAIGFDPVIGNLEDLLQFSDLPQHPSVDQRYITPTPSSQASTAVVRRRRLPLGKNWCFTWNNYPANATEILKGKRLSTDPSDPPLTGMFYRCLRGISRC